jgi:hypothetical protein
MGPILFEETINSERCVRLLLKQFLGDDKTYGNFLQVNATAHTDYSYMNAVAEVFVNFNYEN